MKKLGKMYENDKKYREKCVKFLLKYSNNVLY